MAVLIKAGEYRDKVELQQVVLTKDKYGGEIRTWTTYGTAWAKITAQKSEGTDEKSDGNRVVRSSLFDIYIRYRPDVTAEHKVKHGDVEYWINKVSDTDNLKTRLLLECNRRG